MPFIESKRTSNVKCEQPVLHFPNYAYIFNDDKQLCKNGVFLFKKTYTEKSTDDQ